jgi:hypothetical protein
MMNGGGIPKKVLKIWAEDVNENTDCAITNTYTGGNLGIHRSYLSFIEKWHEQIMNVIPNNYDTGMAYDFNSFAYFQLDESVLNSLLAFSGSPPPTVDFLLNQDPRAYLSHLGGRPKPWKIWRKDLIKYLPHVLNFIEWGKQNNYTFPKIPWAFNRRYKPLIYTTTFFYELAKNVRKAFR